MIAAHDLSPAELAALLHFHADAGVDWLLEDQPLDRFAEFAAARPARPMQGQETGAAVRQSGQRPMERGDTPQHSPQQQPKRQAPARGAPPAPAVQQNVAMPDEQAVAAARFAAESARSLAELKTALEGFSGCNLRNSARSTIFTEGDASSAIMVLGPMPDADDDREGLPFAGKTGLLLDRMLSAIGLERSTIMLGNVVPWRPPGNRTPTPQEVAICLPFIQRQIELVDPDILVCVGRPSAMALLEVKSIMAARGRWLEYDSGNRRIPALPILHPAYLLRSPLDKRLAWRDLRTLKTAIDAL